MVGTTPGLKKEEGKKGLLTDMAKQIGAEEWCSGWLASVRFKYKEGYKPCDLL